MAQICFAIIVFNDDYFLEPIIETICQYGQVVAAEGPNWYWQSKGYTTSSDKTNEILHDLLPEENIVHLQADTKNELANAALSLVPSDTTHIWAVDADELYRNEDIEKVLSLIECDDLDSISFKSYAFYGGFRYYATGFDEELEVHRIKRYYPGCQWKKHRPPTMCNQSGVPYRMCNHLDYNTLDEMGIRMFHYNRVFPKQVEEKESFYYTRAPHQTIDSYFERVYIPWMMGRDVESKFNGVHNFKPSLRPASYLSKFRGEHPQLIQDRLPQYRRLIYDELMGYLLEGDCSESILI